LLLLGFGQQEKFKKVYLADRGEASLLYPPSAALASVNETPHIPAPNEEPLSMNLTEQHHHADRVPAAHAWPDLWTERERMRERRERRKIS
jgi:hypothetical protein